MFQPEKDVGGVKVPMHVREQDGLPATKLAQMISFRWLIQKLRYSVDVRFPVGEEPRSHFRFGAIEKALNPTFRSGSESIRRHIDILLLRSIISIPHQSYFTPHAAGTHVCVPILAEPFKQDSEDTNS